MIYFNYPKIKGFMMKKVIVFFLLFAHLYADDTQQNPHIWNNTQEPSLENDFKANKNTYQTSDKGEAIGVTLVETLFNSDKIIEKKKLSSDFKYLDEFEKSIKK